MPSGWISVALTDVKFPPETKMMPEVSAMLAPSSATPLMLIVSVGPAVITMAAEPLTGDKVAQPRPTMLSDDWRSARRSWPDRARRSRRRWPSRYRRSGSAGRA